jgi:single-stranded-DNA-specific exonuclease
MKEKNLKIFDERIEEIAKEILDKEKIEKKIYIDTKASLKEIINEGEEVIEKLSPFGEGNPEPIFLIENLRVLSKMNNYFYLGEENYFIKSYFENNDLNLPDKIDVVCKLKIIKGEKILKIIDFKVKD